MTVETSVSKAVFTSGSVLSFTFRFYENTDIVVEKTSADGLTVTTLVEGAGAGKYTLTGAGDYNGGTVTLGTALATDEVATVRRVLPLTQLTSIRNLGRFFPNIHEDTFDKLTMVLQQLHQAREDILDDFTLSQDQFTVAITAQQNAYESLITGQQNDYEAAITLQQNNYEDAITLQQNNFETTVNNNVASKANVDNTVLTGNITATLTVADNDLFSIKDSGGTGLFTVSSTGTAGLRDKLTVGSLAIGATDVTSTATEINQLASSGVTNADLVKLHAVTATAAELNKLAGTPAGLTSTEIGYLDGVTSAVQTQLNDKADLTGAPIFTDGIQFGTGGVRGYVGCGPSGNASDTVLGKYALLQSNGPGSNVAVGQYAGWRNTSGENNIFVGYGAGGANTAGTYNICIGRNTATGDFQAGIAIGDVATITKNNQAVIGGSNIVETLLTGVIRKRALDTAPASATATGTLGEIRVTTTHIYVCTATDTWKRTALSTW